MDQAATFDSKRVHIDNLFRMVQYCENVADCRRSQLLNYFGERDFNREECGNFRGAICDNCVSKVCVHLFVYRYSQVQNQKAPRFKFEFTLFRSPSSFVTLQMMLRRLWNVFKIWLSVEEGETTTLSSILWTYSGVKKILLISLSNKSLFTL